MTQLGTYTKEGKPARVAETPADAVRFTFEGYKLEVPATETDAPEADVNEDPAPPVGGGDYDLTQFDQNDEDLSDEDLEALTDPNA